MRTLKLSFQMVAKRRLYQALHTKHSLCATEHSLLLGDAAKVIAKVRAGAPASLAFFIESYFITAQ